MDFALDEHQQDVQRRARAFAATEVAPVAAALDRTGSIPPAVINGVAEVGLLGCEHDFVAYVAGLIEISKEWASLGAVIAVHNSLVCYPISRYGDAAQKNSYLSRLTGQKQLGCYAFAEPSAGSDAGAIRTTAVAAGDDFVLNGHKRFVTSGRQARIAIVYALTDPSKGRDGLSAFIVETDTPGFAVGETNEMLGLRASEAVDVLLRDCRVPKGNLLGGLNQGFAVARDIVEGAASTSPRRPSASARRVSRRVLPRPRIAGSSAGRLPSSRRFSGWWPTCRPRSTLHACWHSAPRRYAQKIPAMPD